MFAFVLGILLVFAIFVGLPVLVLRLYASHKIKTVAPAGVATTTPTTTPASPPPAPRPASKWVWWLAGVIVSVLVITILWWALPTISVPTPVANESSIGKFLSSLDLSGIPFAQSVVALVGATWAPLVLIAAAVVLLIAIIYLFISGLGPLAVLVILGFGIYGGLKVYVQNQEKSVPVKVDFQRAKIGDTKVVRMDLTSTVAVSQRMAILGRDDGVFWTCPTTVSPVKLPFAPKFRVAAGAYTSLYHLVLTDESKQKLVENGTMSIEVKFTMAAGVTNPCAHLEF